ncbi:B-cell receptor CD22-like isoform X1 [Labeo rohita]|uniref:B-cell receptor CD22-like isoform X1 n=1 Tax=Labeo rohita TaxID=84645 RepID=A0A498LKR9_LABRO|nr:B-cell receptor CD22-like isoform X1 [Labeo rohita]
MSDWKLIHVKPEDSGAYYCEAKNKYGAEKSNIIQIDVKYGPQGVTVQHPVNINDLTEGDKLTLKCLVQKSNPAVYQFTWYKNSQAQSETNETLIINKVTADHKGSYHCEADNGIKTAKSNEISVHVKYAPNINIVHNMTIFTQWNWKLPVYLTCSADAYPPVNDYKCESDEFTFRCSTSGSCDYHPEWLIHTSEQKQEWTSSSSTDMITETEENEEDRKVTELKLNVTWKDDNRTLSCRPGKSEDSCQIRNITLSVEYAPKETKATVSPEDVKEGDSVTLSCTSRGRPDVSFTWFKKEKLEESQQMSDWKLINVKPEDSGEYNCEAKNKYGTKKSNIIKINVKYGPKEVTLEPQGSINDLKEGDKLTIKCFVKKSNPPAKQFTWYNNDLMLQQTSETLTIITVAADNKGSYHCQASNSIETVQSNKITISVKYSPRNIKIEGRTSVKVDTSLTLTCSADANPQPHSYTWKHTPGLSSFPLSVKTGQLNIEKVTIQHAGQYTCDVTNSVGTRSNTTKVDVLYVPKNVTASIKGEQRSGSELTLACTARANPALSSFEWEKHFNGVKNTVGHEQKLQFNSLKISDSGQYICIAQNAIGKTKSPSVEIKVKCNSLKMFYQTILPIILLLILIVVAIFLIRRPKSNVHTVYAAIKLPQMKQGKKSPKPHKTGYMDNDATTSTLNYVTLDFKGQNKPEERVPESSTVYAVVSKNKQTKYICIAQNAIGKTESSLVEIKVKYAPNINIVHNMTTSTWEFPVHLTCSADAYPPVTVFKWYREEDNKTVLSHEQNFTAQPQNPGTYYCTADNDIGNSRSKNIILFISSNSLKVFYQTILPIILLLILIVVAIFLIRRPKSNVHTVYAAIKLPQMKQGKKSPKPHKTGYMDNDATTSTLNYVTLDFKGQNKPEERVPESSTVYAVVSKNKQTKNSQSDHDYENVSSACVPKVPFTNKDWESDTSEEDEENMPKIMPKRGKQTLYLGKVNEAEVVLSCSWVIIHPDYNKQTMHNNDIALLKLSSPVRMTSRISPICLPRDSLCHHWLGHNCK